MSMLPSKVMPYLLRLAAPLMDSSIVHWIDLSAGLISRWRKAIVQVSHLPNQICVQESGLAESGTEYT